jgi:hypothetical protein
MLYVDSPKSSFRLSPFYALGYGDFVPFEASQYIFTSAYILVGVGVVGSLLGILISSFLDQVV